MGEGAAFDVSGTLDRFQWVLRKKMPDVRGENGLSFCRGESCRLNGHSNKVTLFAYESLGVFAVHASVFCSIVNGDAGLHHPQFA